MNTSINFSTFLQVSGKQDKKTRVYNHNTIVSDDISTINIEENAMSQTACLNDRKTSMDSKHTL